MRAGVIIFGLITAGSGVSLLLSCVELEKDCTLNPAMKCPGNDGSAAAAGSAGTGETGGTGGTVGSGGGVPCTVDGDCEASTECRAWHCNTITHLCTLEHIAAGTAVATQTPHDCAKVQCDGQGNTQVVADATDLPDDGNECMICDGVTPSPVAVADNTACGQPSCNNEIALHGTCQSGSCNMIQTGCGSYRCDATQCKTTCTADADCISTHYCDVNASSCKHKKTQGNSCGGSNECGNSQPCTDGFCCQNTCTGPCVSCELGGLRGTCASLPKGVIDECASGQACNGSGACAPLNGKTAVGPKCASNNDCFNGVCIHQLCRIPEGSPCEQGYTSECPRNFCNQDGKCGACSTDADCAPGICDPDINACKLVAGETCGVDADCVSSNCSNAKCQ